MTAPLTAIINEAHHNVLRLRAATILPTNDLNHTPEFLVRAGDGAFICKARSGTDISANNEPMFFVQAITWIADDMVHDDQVLLVADGQPGERLIDGWLLPRPVRRIIPSGDRIVLTSWIEGLPDLLATPEGRA
jgi:hypothetical protein